LLGALLDGSTASADTVAHHAPKSLLATVPARAVVPDQVIETVRPVVVEVARTANTVTRPVLRHVLVAWPVKHVLSVVRPVTDKIVSPVVRPGTSHPRVAAHPAVAAPVRTVVKPSSTVIAAPHSSARIALVNKAIPAAKSGSPTPTKAGPTHSTGVPKEPDRDPQPAGWWTPISAISTTGSAVARSADSGVSGVVSDRPRADGPTTSRRVGLESDLLPDGTGLGPSVSPD
jgi:hypothetical protein